MHKVKRLAMALTMLSLAGLVTACAAVRPSDTIRAEVRDAVVAAEPGTTVHLFYGMSKTAKLEFCPGAVITVYRVSDGYGRPTYTGKEQVGKIKVTKDLGEHYIEAVVLEGSLRAGDIAMAANSECLIQHAPKPGPSSQESPAAPETQAAEAAPAAPEAPAAAEPAAEPAQEESK